MKTFLQGGRKSIVEYLTERMSEAAGEYRFEDAQFFKDQIEALGGLGRKRFDWKRPQAGIGLRGTLELKQTLGMRRLPEKIVCFDVSNIHGDEAVASRVCFFRELANTMEYRRYKIKRITGIDDYAMIREALDRMLVAIGEGRESGLPDLILIDGGKGHLNSALRVLKDRRFEQLEVVAIAKQFEYVYSPRSNNPIVFQPGSSALRLLQKIRDEAHRFAISYHRSLKQKQLSRSLLDQIEGIGAKRKRILLTSFSSLEELRDIPVAVLARLEGMDQPSAEKVIRFLLEYFPRVRETQKKFE